MVIAYETESSAYRKKSLYLNITNRCNNRCVFCHRFDRKYSENQMDELWLTHEPTLEEILEAVFSRDLSQYDEIVFCGYGEPTCRLDILLKTAEAIKARFAIPIRLNTNGLADTLYHRDVTPDFKGHIDTLSISLNASNAKAYDALCRPRAPQAFEHLLTFAKNAGRFCRVCLTVIDNLPQEDIAQCQKIADTLGAELILRPYLE
ncbi:MAG: TatD family nuclease-associated radical SAM protein [Eubacterium sp.]|nr:TatD family nuclease-associated radical SAM protein [Eubacterium sp.]